MTESRVASEPVNIDWAAVSRSHVGLVRKCNEDACTIRSDISLWAVADGMGGHEAGELASQWLVDALDQVRRPASVSGFVDRAEDAILEASQRIRRHSSEALGGKPMGSTVVSLLIWGRLATCLWVGDSRLYRLRQGGLEQVSRDHSQVGDMLACGQITPEQARTHPKRNLITRAVGAEAKVYVDIAITDVQPGDAFLLCTDGLHGEVLDEELADLIRPDAPEASADAMLERVIERGARDNVTFILVHQKV